MGCLHTGDLFLCCTLRAFILTCKLREAIFSPQFHNNIQEEGKERTEMYHVNGFVWSKHQTLITTAVVMKGIYRSFMGEFIFHRCVFPIMLIRFFICNTHMYI